MLILGLTGSVAMGKSTTARIFAEAGIAVFDADREVHRLYRTEAAPFVETAFPGVVVDGVVDRARLADKVLADVSAMRRLESIVHPLVRAAEESFLAHAAAAGRRIAVLDIPLLFETGSENRVDAIVVVTASEAIQRTRLRERPGMSDDRIAALLKRQMPDAEKRRRAHFIIDTGRGLDAARKAVADILRAVAPLAGGGQQVDRQVPRGRSRD